MSHNERVVFLVVALLGLFALGGLAGVIYLIAVDKSASDLNVVAGPTGVALGALGAMLATTRSGTSPVEVMNKADDPVPVDAHPESEAPPKKR